MRGCGRGREVEGGGRWREGEEVGAGEEEGKGTEREEEDSAGRRRGPPFPLAPSPDMVLVLFAQLDQI